MKGHDRLQVNPTSNIVRITPCGQILRSLITHNRYTKIQMLIVEYGKHKPPITYQADTQKYLQAQYFNCETATHFFPTYCLMHQLDPFSEAPSHMWHLINLHRAAIAWSSAPRSITTCMAPTRYAVFRGHI